MKAWGRPGEIEGDSANATFCDHACLTQVYDGFPVDALFETCLVSQAEGGLFRVWSVNTSPVVSIWTGSQ